jgi:predicted dehydrogenase
LRRYTVGFVGGGQVARAHRIAFGNMPLFYGPNEAVDLEIVAEASEVLARAAAKRLGFSRWTDDWRRIVRDSKVDLIDVMTPTYLHKEPAIEALERGKSVICEKPLATTEKDAREMYEAAKKTKGRTLVGFNYRRVPAVALAKQKISKGHVGRIHRIRSQFMEDWGGPQFPLTWRFEAEKAGAGALGDLGSHAIDLVRYLAGEPREVCGVASNFIRYRAALGDSKDRKVRSHVDDVASAVMKLEGGAIAEVGASWIAPGRKVQLEFEVNGSEGTLYFTMERPNELKYYSSADAKESQGFKTIYFGPDHPYGGTLIFGTAAMGTGYVDSITFQMHDFLASIEHDKEYAPSFYDGWKASQLIGAIQESSKKGKWVRIQSD